jgi:hypothetical protein
MFALLVQYGGFYGVSARLINDETSGEVYRKLMARGGLATSDITCLMGHTPGDPSDQYTIYLMPVYEGQMQFGFDTGKMEEGFQVIDDLLKDV